MSGFTFQLTILDDLTISSIDVGQPGKANDAMVFRMSDLWVPSRGRVEHLICRQEFHILGDGAYPSKSYLLKPVHRESTTLCTLPSEVWWSVALAG